MTDRPGVPLSSILRRHTLGTALVPLLVVELSLIALYIVFGRQVASSWREEVTNELRQGLQELADARARQLALVLKGIERQTELVRTQAGMLLRGEVEPREGYRPELYAVGKNGSLYQVVDDGGASIFYSSGTVIGEEQRRKLAATEPLDPLLERAVASDAHVVAAYLNTHDELNRYYPFIPNTDEVFTGGLQMEDFAFYYTADAEHDPQREVVWTENYLDPAGHGWMVSSVAPVYRDDVLEGVVGLDVTVPVLAERVLDLDLPYDAPALLLTSEGSPLGLNAAAAERFDAGAAILYEAPSSVGLEERTLEAESPLARLLGDADAARRLRARLEADAGLSELTLGGETFFVVHSDIDEPSWRLVVLVSKADAMAPIEAIESRSKILAIAVVGGMALFYALFFHVIYRRSRWLAGRVVGPIDTLTEATGQPRASAVPSVCGITEIDTLKAGFEEMVAANRSHQARIERLNENLEARVEQEVTKNREKDHLLLEQSRLASLGEMVASIAHQWRQPLTSLNLLIDDLRLRAEDGESSIEHADLRDYLDDAQHLIRHMSETVDDFRSIYVESSPPRVMRVRTVIDQALSIADGTLRASSIEVALDDRDPDHTSIGRSNELCHVLLNLLSNAQSVLTERGVSKPRIEIRLWCERARRIIEIEDNAGGIAPAIASRLFEPFATSRDGGTGLGLYMSRRLVVERFGGRLEPREGAQGACFRIELPPQEPTGDVDDAPEGSESSPS